MQSWNMYRIVILLSWALSYPMGMPLSQVQPSVKPVPAPSADPVPPQFLRDLPDLRGRINPGDFWTIGGGYLYWAKCNLVDSTSGYLRRWPLRGGRVVTMQNSSFCRTGAWAADETGLYYWNGTNIVHSVPALNVPFVEQIIAASPQPSAPIILNNGTSTWRDYIFWVANNTLYSANRFTGKRLAEPEPLGANAHSLVFAHDGYFYWFADGVLYRALKACLGFGGGACVKEVVASEDGERITDATKIGPQRDATTFPLWTSAGLIRGILCRLEGIGMTCTPNTSYTAPGGNSVGAPAGDGQFLFWVENSRNCTGAFCFWSGKGSLMKWNLRQSQLQPRPFDTPAAIACGEDCGGNYLLNNLDPVVVSDGWVYFNTSNGLSRIRVDAPPIPTDLAVNGWEVTQGIQNLSNDTDLVPLVAGKTTYVRLYSRKLSGPNIYGIDAALYGTQGNGQPLPGSPLRSLNGAQDNNTNPEPDRKNLRGSWLFQIPDSWTNSGTIWLQPMIDPQQIWNDPNRANNTLDKRSFSFGRVAPVCLVFIPVRTNSPVQMFGPSHQFAIDMTRRLLPTGDVWTYRQTNDIAELEVKWGGPLNAIPYPGFGPYELQEDSGKILLSLFERDQLSDDPDECDDAGARTHYVGVVAAEEKGGNGSSWRDHDNLWFRLPPANFAADWKTDRAVTLAHELGHNYGRKHINCGGPEPEQGFDAYPYDPCQLDVDDASNRYYGFTFNPQTGNFDIIPPTTAGDLMSYAQNHNPPKPRWISDVTWRRLYSAIPDRKLAALARAQHTTEPNLAAATSVMLMTGLIDSAAPSQSVLNNAWVYPSSNASQAMLRKWQRYAAPTQAAQPSTTAADASYHLRLLDAAGNVLDDRAITPLAGDDDVQPQVRPFMLAFPAPAEQIARIELLNGDTVIASRTIGTSKPTIQILSPAAGETIDDQMTIAWQASDADNTDLLLYNIQYSPNNGQTWRALLTSFANRSGTDTITLNLRDLSGIPASTTGGLLRIAASDGYNTTVATSQPFVVVNHAPQPYIDAPGRAPTPAGQTVLLRGGAIDPEDGQLNSTSLRWILGDQELGVGAQQQIAGLAPGDYELTLIAHDASGKEGRATTTLTIAPLGIPQASSPTLDGTCDDDGYATAAQVALPPYDDGSQAFVRLLRSSEALWACFIGMKRSGDASPRTLASLRVDTNYSRAAQPQPGDWAFVLGDDGVIATYTGTGTGYAPPSPDGFSGQVSASDNRWMAEMRIGADVLGGWGHVVGLSIEHVDVGAPGDNYVWPNGTTWNNPSTWATVALGDAAHVQSLAPDSALVGTDAITITLTGSGFANNATVLWNGVSLPTTVISSTQMQAIVGAASLTVAGMVDVAVANPGLQAAPSNSHLFSVLNPVPHITRLALTGKTLTVTGSNFVNNARIIWNGVERPATVVSSTQLQATLEDSDLVGAIETPVTVFNPGPGGGVSKVAIATLSGMPSMVYLPLVQR